MGSINEWLKGWMNDNKKKIYTCVGEDHICIHARGLLIINTCLMSDVGLIFSTMSESSADPQSLSN